MKRNNNSQIHVIHLNNQWKVKRENSERSLRNFETQKEAEDFARRISKKDNAELIIHGKNGKIQKKDSHGHDSYPPKG